MGALILPGKRYPGIVMEYCERGSLHDLLYSSMIIDHEMIVTIITDVVSALSFLHNMSILHNDIKSTNVLLTSNFQVKVADFGLIINNSPSIFMAPELIKSKIHTKATNVYAFGIFLCECFMRGCPYLNEDIKSILNKVSDTKLSPPYRPKLSNKIPTKWIELINKCCDSSKFLDLVF